MVRHIHIHLHRKTTADNWEEGKHPRADNGQFGKGSGGKSSGGAKKSAITHKVDTNTPAGHSLLHSFLKHENEKAANKGRQTSGTEAPGEPSHEDLKKHPSYHPDDYDYLHKQNGMSHSEILAKWDKEHAARKKREERRKGT